MSLSSRTHGMVWCGWQNHAHTSTVSIRMHTHTHTHLHSQHTYAHTHTQYVPACLSVPQGFQHEVRAAALGPEVSEVPGNCSGTCGCSAGVGADCFCSKLLPTLIKCCLAQHVVCCVWHVVWCVWHGVGWAAVVWCGGVLWCGVVGCCGVVWWGGGVVQCGWPAAVGQRSCSMASVFIPQVENYRNCLQTCAVQMSTPTSDILQPGHSVILCGGEGGGERVWGVGVLVETHYWCETVLGTNQSVEELHEWPKFQRSSASTTCTHTWCEWASCCCTRGG